MRKRIAVSRRKRPAPSRRRSLAAPPEAPAASADAPTAAAAAAAEGPAEPLHRTSSLTTGLLVGLPALGLVAYVLGGLTLIAQARDAGLPWKTMLVNVDARLVLSTGVRVIAVAGGMFLLGLASVAVILVLAQRRSAAPSRPSRPVDTTRADFIANLCYAGLAGVAVSTPVVHYVSTKPWAQPVALGTVVASLAIGTVVAFIPLKRPAVRAAAATTVLVGGGISVALFASALFALLMLALLMGAIWVFTLDELAGEHNVTPFVLGSVPLVLGTTCLATGLWFVSGQGLRFDTVEYAGAENGRAGLVSSNDRFDVLVVCSATAADAYPELVRHRRDSAAADSSVDGRPYRIPVRRITTLLGLITDTEIWGTTQRRPSLTYCGGRPN